MVRRPTVGMRTCRETLCGLMCPAACELYTTMAVKLLVLVPSKNRGTCVFQRVVA